MSLLYAMILSLALAAGAAVAQDWVKGLAEQGHAVAQNNLGEMYRKGDGVLQDYAEAVKWFQLSAGQGISQAQFNLGVMYSKGWGVLRDNAEAVKWYRLAAEREHAPAQNNLGVMYENGEGVLQNNIRSHMCYNIASANGLEKASKWRDETAAKMTSADISEAQKMARECMNSNYQNCGR